MGHVGYRRSADRELKEAQTFIFDKLIAAYSSIGHSSGWPPFVATFNRWYWSGVRSKTTCAGRRDPGLCFLLGGATEPGCPPLELDFRDEAAKRLGA